MSVPIAEACMAPQTPCTHVLKSDPYKRNTQPWSHPMSGLIEGASSGSTQVHKSDPYKRNTLPWSHLTSDLIKGASSGSTQVHKSDPYKKNTLQWSHLTSVPIAEAWLLKPHALTYIRVTHIKGTTMEPSYVRPN